MYLKNISSSNNKIIEYIKFNIVGISNFTLSQIFYISMCTVFNFNYILAYTLTSIISVSCSYFFNSKFTFNQEKYRLSKFFSTIFIYVLEYLINMTIIINLVDKLNFSELIAPLLSPVITTPIVFCLMRYTLKK